MWPKQREQGEACCAVRAEETGHPGPCYLHQKSPSSEQQKPLKLLGEGGEGMIRFVAIFYAFFKSKENKKISSLSNLQIYSIVNSSCYMLIPRTYLSHNWKFVSFDFFHPTPPSHLSPLVNTNLISSMSLFVCLFLKNNSPTTLCQFLLHNIVIQYFYTFQHDDHKSSYVTTQRYYTYLLTILHIFINYILTITHQYSQ